jgi:membrane-bound ClpP family serine protease
MVVLGACLGDVMLALSMDAINPTRVLVGPGDRKHHNSEVLDMAVVVEGFGDDNEGYILVRGERWRARTQSQNISMFQIGDHVKVIERTGLVLVVESAGNDT